MTGTHEPVSGLALDLSAHRNNTACWAPGAAPTDGFDGFGRAFPAPALLPCADELRLPADFGWGAADNVTCEGQALTVDSGTPPAIALHVVGAGTQGVVHETFHLRSGSGDGTDVTVRLGDFLTRGEVPGARCYRQADFLYDIAGRPEPSVKPRLWHAVAVLHRPTPCVGLRLPFNPDLHLFGVWLSPVDDWKEGP
ncbi:hypothetical protein [Streptomyces prasinopilosus]|uniref:Uncharacterized protein n=1 Tax=Streptomyces prasinopilosus TaxID=67344 RepID=A0A1G6M258_9ACTN|nr:hypothetical protein [Streptomyces prasinopilosus]SDC49628.1 hypothetical protein SAMN05216505_102354 [Streptomyces prasinopilosus]